MKRRDFIAQTGSALALAGLAPQASAQNGFQEGKHYVKLSQPLAVSAPEGKIEVLEFFWYSCPHCNAFEPTLEAWARKLPPEVVFRRVPVGFRPNFEPQQRLYATIEALGLIDSLHRKVFHAIHQQGQKLDKPEAIFAFVEKNGADRAKFTEMYNSFGMQSKVRQFSQLSAAYKIDGVPSIGIHGRFYTSPSLAGGEGTPESEGGARALALTDLLVARLRKGG